MTRVDIQPHQHDVALGIPGLEFSSNFVSLLRESPAWFSKKVSSSQGPLVSDFVTHGPNFEYSTYGIHVGQDDRLTFFGPEDEVIAGHFIDCRKSSPTLHQKFSCTFHPSPHRKLIIPRGVAHTFDGLAGIVTRDEPVWYSGESNPHWNVNNDLISILRTAEEFPTIPVNNLKLTEELHTFMTQLSQAVLDKPRAYSTRFNLNIAGENRYVMFQETTWDNEGRTIQPIIDDIQGPGIFAQASKYAITGKASWTLVPNTGSGVADIMYLPTQINNQGGQHLFVHRRTKKWYTFLTAEGANLDIETIDLRPSSQTFLSNWQTRTLCDPRVSICIEPGIAYRFTVDQNIWVRSENEVFVAEDEPRADLPAFGRDLELVNRANIKATQPILPPLRCPDRVVRQMAHHELSQLA